MKDHMSTRKGRGFLAALIGLALALSACTVPAAADRSGSVPSADVELVMAAPNGSSEITSFADAVAERSNASIHVDILGREATAEIAGVSGGKLLDAVQDGDVALAAIPVRDLTGLGMRSLDPLIAPFVIDSLVLQAAVLKDSDLVGSMVDDLDIDGVAVVGLLPGPLQYAYGVDRDLTSPKDFEGASIAMSPGEVAERGLTALGAHPVISEFNGAPIDGFDGFILQLQAVTGNGYHEPGGSIAIDAPLWPRPYIVVANADALAALSPEHREALNLAAADAIDGVLAAERKADRASMSILCTSGDVHFTHLGEGELTALRLAVEPVVDDIRSDPERSASLDRINALRAQVRPESAPSCPTISADWPKTVSGRLDGTYSSDTTADDLRAQGIPEVDVVPGNWGHWVLVVDDGRFALSQENESACTWGFGRWRMDERIARMTMEGGGSEQPDDPVWRRGEDFAWWWIEFDGMLQLASAMQDGPPGLTFTRMSVSPDPSAFPGRCPPPAEAFSSE
jgi:TRAP-type C4-dicarboxylate transport system substrate-binding protein